MDEPSSNFPVCMMTDRLEKNERESLCPYVAGSEHEAVINLVEGRDPLTRSSSMQLPRLEKRHQGSYECIAINPSGEDALDAYLDVVD